jgi:tetratricopeptide (TPR) repeat protein
VNPQRLRQIESLFHSALELCDAARARFLDDACAGDRLLRDEVESLVAASDLSGNPLNTPVYEVGLGLLAAGSGETLAGRSVGRYEVLESVGSGGMGEVHLALDPELGRKVALKVLPACLSCDADFVSRFRREARAASAISHPNVVHVYETGVSGGRHYIAMEYVEGETLRGLLSAGRVRASRAVEIVRQVCSALDAAHAGGVIHRDVKPENIMLTRDGRVKVLDFGLAKLIRPDGRADGGAASNFTEPGRVMGTCRYMAPEQVRGVEVDRRADIWGVGVVFYEMLAGRPPFDGEREADVIAAVLKTEPATLQHASPSVSSKLERIVARSLCKQAGGRYATAAEMIFELNELARELDCGDRDARAADARPTHSERPVGSRGGARRRTLTWAAFVAACCLTLAGLLLWRGFAPRGVTSPPSGRVSTAPTLNAAAREAYRLGRLHLEKRTGDDLKKAIGYFEEAAGSAPDYAPAYAGLAQAYVLLPFYSETAPGDAYLKANEEAERALRLDENLAEAHVVRAKYREQYVWDFAGAEREYRRAIELDPGGVTAHQWYAECLSHMSRHEEAVREIGRAHELDPTSPAVNAVTGLILIQARRFDDAVGQLLDTISLNKDFPLAHEFLGDAYVEKGMYSQAIREHEIAARLNGKGNASEAGRRADALRSAYSVGGARAYWLGRLAQETRDSRSGYVYPAGVAMMFARIGETEKAFEWLERAYAARDESILWLKNEQAYDRIRPDPRFQEMVRRVGLPPSGEHGDEINLGELYDPTTPGQDREGPRQRHPHARRGREDGRLLHRPGMGPAHRLRLLRHQLLLGGVLS